MDSFLTPQAARLRSLQAFRSAQKKIEEARHSKAKELDISGQSWTSKEQPKLAELPEELRRNTDLEVLILSHNELTTLPEWLGQLTQLHTLIVSDNQLTTLPQSLIQLKRLQSLDLSRNELTAIPEWLGQLTQLDTLILSHNRLTASPRGLNQLERLRSLALANTQLTEIPEWLRQLKQLEAVDFSYNQLTTLPNWLGEFHRLRSLSVARNQFNQPLEWLGYFGPLCSLDLSDNQLATVPDGIGQLTELETLDLKQNRLSRLPDSLGKLKRLKHLNLYHNMFHTLPDSVFQLESLENIGLGGNQVKDLPAPSDTAWRLRSLNLGDYGGGNPLGVVPSSIRSFKWLEGLYLQSCELQVIPSWIGELFLIKTLYLGNNSLTDLPATLSELSHLETLEIGNNPLNPELLAAHNSGIASVQRYLREIGKGARNRYEAKLLIRGDGNEGKTCVSRALRGLPFRAQKTTRGVDVVQWRFPHPHDKEDLGKEVTLNIWDFEGQEISHQSHQFFLTSQSLYLLVFKCRDQFLMDRAEYWMDTIRARAPHAKVILVISQCEDRSPHVSLDKIQAQYHDMLAKKWFFAVGCENGKNIDKLKAFLQRSASELQFMGSLWPRSYDKAEEKIKKSAKKLAYISRGRLNDIFLKAGIAEDTYEDAAAAMSRLGVITQFPECADLRDFVVLKPQWLTKAISKVMEDTRLSEDQGKIALKRMEAIWSKSRFPGMFATFHDCMKEFELCYDLEDQSRSCLVPLRFGYVAPPIPWMIGGGAKERRMHYKLNIRPPMGLISRFIVKTHHMIVKTTGYPSGIYWHNGVFLRSTSPVPSEAICEFFAEDGTFRVQVRAAFPQNMCEQIRGYLQALFSFFGGLAAERSYGCIKVDPQTGREEQCSGLHTEKRIYAAISKNRQTIDCEFEDHEVDPRRLVGGFSSFNDFVIQRVAAVVREEMDKAPEWAVPFMRGVSALLEWVTNNNDKLDKLIQGQTTLAAEFKQEAELKLHEYLKCMSTMLDDRAHSAAPGLISIMTKDGTRWNPTSFFSKTYVLIPYCECDGNIHACEDGRVEFTKDKVWWKKTAPWIARGTKLFAAGLQLAFAGLPLAIGAETAKSIEDQVKLMEELTKHLELGMPNEDLDDASSKVIGGAVTKDLRGSDRETALTRAALARFLEETAPDNYRARRWGSLRRFRMPDNSYRWLCDSHKP